MTTDDYRTLQRVIRNRRTDKVLGCPEQPLEYAVPTLEHYDSVVWQALIDCGQAPFHYDRRLDGLAEPWRVYWLSCSICRRLASSLTTLIADIRPGNKLAGLLAGCGSLGLFAWIPETADGETGKSPDKLAQINREHLSATAAAIQNFLLLCTAAELQNYWSSGTLIEQHLFEPLGIPAEQRLAGAVFVHYPDGTSSGGPPEMVGGKQREKRDGDNRWLQRINY